MKRILTTIFILLFIAQANSQSKIYLRSGDITNTAPEKNPQNDAAYFADNIFDNRYFLWLQFRQFPTDAVKESLEKTGIVLYGYLPDNAFVASFPINYDFSKLNQFGVYGVCKPRAAYKIDASLFTPEKISWAVSGDRITVDVSFLDCVSKTFFISSLQNTGANFNLKDNKSEDVVSLNGTINDLQKIASHPLVLYVEPTSAAPVLEDYSAIANHRINTVQTTDNWTNGKKLDGSGITVAIGDGEMAGTHIDFTGRLLSNTSASGTPSVWHSDHVTGIIGGAGNLNPTYRGQARGANLRVYDYYEPATLFPGIYNTDSVRVISHSLGQGCNVNYNSNARSSDIFINTYPKLMYVHSSGNSGTDGTCSTILPYRTITGGYKAGKNVITVGNLDKGDVINSTSSCGPLSDGRIKPEVTSVGTSVNSTQPNNGYVSMDGTSMACPAVSGNVAVLMQAYKIKNNSEPDGSLIKAILMNTADDLGNDGPDFRYGFGRINIRKAVKLVEDNRFLSSTITTNATNTHTIAIPSNVASAKIMVYWADKEATAGVAKSLVNDIDAKLKSADNTEFLPWVIDLTSGINITTCGTPAINGVDSINNVEQIEVVNPVSGNYTLNVLGKKIPNGPQKYYVVYEFVYNEITVTNPIGGETFVPSEVQRIRWDASDGTATFTVAYSVNNGTTWTNASTTIPATRRYYDWTVPSTAATAQALIKVTRGTASDISDTNFVILKVPTNVTFVDVCQNQTKVSWTAVTNATSYDVFRLGEKYMELAGTTTTTNIVLDNQDNGVMFWYAVRAKLGTKNANGRLTNAISHTNTSTVVCPLAVKLISFNAALKNSNVNLIWRVASEENMINYIVEKSETPNFENVEIVGQVKPTNQLGEHQYQLIDYNLQANATFYYRLKMVENGKILYSSVQSVKVDKWTNENFSLSPNPANQYVNIIANKLNSNVSNLKIKIFNELGVEVLNKSIKNATSGSSYSLTITSLPNGNYFVNVVDEMSNTILYRQQIVIIK